jgi:hypothetical protein
MSKGNKIFFGWPLEHEGWSLHFFKLRLDFMHSWKKVGLEENPKNNCKFFNEIWWKNILPIILYNVWNLSFKKKLWKLIYKMKKIINIFLL